MRLALRIEGEYAKKVIDNAQSTAKGWNYLAAYVSGYVETLAEHDDLSLEHDEWDMFYANLRARSLKSWDDFSLVEAPSGHLWGVEK